MSDVQDRRMEDTEPWRAEEIAYEHRTTDEVWAAIRHLAALIGKYPHAWNWGDGNGGAVLREFESRLNEHGLSMFEERLPASGPVRKKMSPKLTLATFKRDGYRCVACGSREELTVDHIVAVVRGGENVLHNLQTLCSRCNTSKGKKSMEEWSG